MEDGPLLPQNLLPLRRATVLDCSVFPEMDSIIDAKEFQIERKRFHVEFRENDRGKFLRITEEAHGRRNTIIVPSTGVGDFTAAIGEVLHASRSAGAN